MNDHIKKPNTKLTILLEIMFVLFIICVFIFLMLKYLPYMNEKENPRFAEIDLQALKTEASSIQPMDIGNKPAKNIFVLNYHVVTKEAPQDDYEISYEQFKANMFELKRQGYQTVSLEDLYSFLRGEKQLPDKSFVLTFDDGAKAAFYNVDPVLEALNYTAVMFVITGGSIENTKSPYYLNVIELSHLQRTGRWEIESHTHKSHFRLPINEYGEVGPALTNKLWLADQNRLETNEEYYARVSSDLELADSLLERNFHKNITSFALPFGDFGEKRSNYPSAHGILQELTFSRYKLVFSQFTKNTAFRANYNDKLNNSYLVVRLSVDGLRTPESLIKEIEASRVRELPYIEDYTNSDRWPVISGEASFTKESIILKSASDTPIDQIRFAYLDGSYLWKDYNYQIELKSSAASTVLLLSRLKDSGNYVACRYTPNAVSVLNVKNNIPSYIKDSGTLQANNLINGTRLSMAISGNKVSCSTNGIVMLNTSVSEMPPYGGVGVRAEGFATSDKDFAFGNILIR